MCFVVACLWQFYLVLRLHRCQNFNTFFLHAYLLVCLFVFVPNFECVLLLRVFGSFILFWDCIGARGANCTGGRSSTDTRLKILNWQIQLFWISWDFWDTNTITKSDTNTNRDTNLGRFNWLPPKIPNWQIQLFWISCNFWDTNTNSDTNTHINTGRPNWHPPQNT